MIKPRSIFALAALLLVLVAAAIAFNNGPSRPIKGHEIYVAETASEMIARDNYLFPYFNGEPRLQKPPLAYWMSIAFHSVLGKPGTHVVSELESRLSSLISGILVLAVTFLLANAVFGDRRIALVSASLLGTSWIFFSFTRSARPEMLYTLFCTLQILGMVIAARRHAEGRSTVPGAALAWASVTVALMTKGPQFPLFLMAGAMLALWLRTPRPLVRQILHPAMGLVLLAVVLPYFGYLATQVDDAFSLWSQELTQGTSVPVWLRPLRFYYPWALFKGMAPWFAIFALGVVHCWKRRHTGAAMLIWPILISLLFLSFAGKLREHYVLPLIPLCAVLAAWAAVDLFDRARQDTNARWLLRKVLVAQAALIGVLLLVIGWLSLDKNPFSGLPMWPAATPWILIGAGFAAASFYLAARRPAWTFGAMVLSLLATSTAISRAGLDVSAYWATAGIFARQVSERVPPNEAMVYQNVQAPALIYYGRRIGPQLRLSEWLKSSGNGEPPLMVCQRRCLRDGRVLEGEVLLRQQDMGQRRKMILFKARGLIRDAQTPPPSPGATPLAAAKGAPSSSP